MWRFDLSISSLHDIITRISQFLSFIAKDVIQWPTENDQQNTKSFYDRNKHFPNIIGAVDGSHVKIDKPVERHTDYFNRKDYYSIHVQGTCNHSLKFIDICIGYPGSVHDARVFQSSSLRNKIGTLANDTYILRDSVYPLLPQLLTPYRDNGHFNRKLSSCRVSIEHAFGVLKQRFRQLYHVKLKGHTRICHFIRACCVLHNLANQEDLSIFENEAVNVEDNVPDIEFLGIPQRNALDVRDGVCNKLYINRNN